MSSVVTGVLRHASIRSRMRVAGPTGRPIDLLVARDFAAFETALAVLSERGFVIRGN